MAQLSWANSTFNAPWIHIPYAGGGAAGLSAAIHVWAGLVSPVSFPSAAGEWRWPLLTPRALAVGIAMAISCSMNSVGCYVLCGRLLQVPRLPPHACNRGLFMEGLGSLLAGLLGTPGGTASSIANTCATGLTQVCQGGGNGLARDGEAAEQVCGTCNGQAVTETALGKAGVYSRMGRETEQGVMLPILIFPFFFLPGWLPPLSASKCPGMHGAGHVPEAGRAPHPHPTGSSRWVPCPAPCCGTCSLPGTA